MVRGQLALGKAYGSHQKKYVPDVFCFGKIILELKAVGALADEHRRQILNYLRMTKCKLGLLINFGSYPRVRFSLEVIAKPSALTACPSA